MITRAQASSCHPIISNEKVDLDTLLIAALTAPVYHAAAMAFPAAAYPVVTHEHELVTTLPPAPSGVSF